MPLPSTLPNVCTICGGAIVEFESPAYRAAVAFRCERCWDEPHSAPLTRDTVVDYLAAAALFSYSHPAPTPSSPTYAEDDLVYRLGRAFLGESIKLMGRVA